MQMKQIELIFENCERITFEANDIGRIHIGPIKTVIDRVAINSITEQHICRDFWAEIHKDADIPYFPFDDETMVKKKFERITDFDDITWIRVVFNDGTEREIAVEWRDEYPDKEWTVNNLNQHSYISKCGHLYILISPKYKAIYDVFGMDIEDKDSMDFRFISRDKGDKNE